MECNRDEALRAKGLAEVKMQNNDFEGARKIALKARQLLPDLDNISQLITVCDVHCSAQRNINGAEKDLYGILQVENVADEAIIRKQYRKLALVLHPDKNKFPGAEAAFKLIGEANMILSDKGKRSCYDIKCKEPARASVTKLQNRKGNQSSYARTQFGGQNKFNDVPNSQLNGMNHRQQSTSQSGSRPSFWTSCSFCNIKYEYYRDFVNRPLRCQHCSKLFIAYDIGAQGAARGPHFVQEEIQSSNQGSNRTQPPFSQQKEDGKREKVKVNIQKDGQFPSSVSHQTSNTGVKSAQHTKTKDTKESGNEGVTKPKVNVQKPIETETPKDTIRKRGRKMGTESSESNSDIEDTFAGVGGGSVGGSADRRRSSRQRQRVSYREDAADDFSSHKRSRLKKLSSDIEDTKKKEVAGSDVAKEAVKQKASAHADVSMQNEKDKVKGEEAVTLDDHSKSDSDSLDSDPELVHCLDPEFANFDKDKEAHRFAVDQIWACYDSVDSMPRFYAKIKKVHSSDFFKVQITWLEAEPDNDLEAKWADEGLPVACGKFVLGETEITKDLPMFSHQIAYQKGGTRFSYVIYPQKGEIWALFKDWDIKWSLDPENHRKYKFDIVEILSVHDNVVSVAFLLKVKGFVSLFQRTIWAGLAEHKIPFNELFRFSHRIPSVKLTGTERAGVPIGSFELDTASLPGDLEEYYYSNETKIEPEKVELTTGFPNTPKKPVNSESKNGLELRRSPRGLKNQKQVDPNPCFMQEVGLDQSNGVKLEQTVHDFSADKQINKFHVGQIWAFWERNNMNRQSYAQIKQIDSQPVRVHISLLKPCNIPSNYGLFKVCSGKPKLLPLDSFSHIVKAEASGKSLFNIYPRGQQIWGLYKKQDGDLGSGECEIVEVLESDESGIKVLFLMRVAGYKSVFQAPKIQQRSTARIVVVPHKEMNRFSHRIPAIHFTEEKDGCLRGCWELDPAAITGMPLVGVHGG